jgi:hypothetical protein
MLGGHGERPPAARAYGSGPRIERRAPTADRGVD